MVDITDLLIDERWPAIKRWLETTHGPGVSIKIHQQDSDDVPDFSTAWAFYSFFFLDQWTEDIVITMYVAFRDPEQETVFRLKWL